MSRRLCFVGWVGDNNGRNFYSANVVILGGGGHNMTQSRHDHTMFDSLQMLTDVLCQILHAPSTAILLGQKVSGNYLFGTSVSCIASTC